MSSPWVASSSNIYFAAGSVGIGSALPTHTLDVSGSVAVSGATPIYTNGIAIGTIINGTWLAQSSATVNIAQNLYTITVSPGTWMIACSVDFSGAAANGLIYLTVGPTSGAINQTGGLNRVCSNILASNEVALQSTVFQTIASTTTYYCIGQSSTGGYWSNAFSSFYAVKIV